MFRKLTKPELKQISQLSQPNKVLTVAEMPSFNSGQMTTGWAFYLDAIQDPGNLGSIFRIADWFGIKDIILGPGTVDPYNTKVIQATMGAFLRVRFHQTSLSEIKTKLPDWPIYAADMNGTNIFETNFGKNGILVIGNEGNGVSEESRALSDAIISIPAADTGGAESLNAAVATGICVAVIRQDMGR